MDHRVVLAHMRDVHFTSGAVPRRIAVVVIVFRAQEVRQYLGEAPAGIAQLGPFVEIARVATEVHHAVGGAAAAKDAATRQQDLAAAELWLRH